MIAYVFGILKEIKKMEISSYSNRPIHLHIMPLEVAVQQYTVGLPVDLIDAEVIMPCNSNAQ